MYTVVDELPIFVQIYTFIKKLILSLTNLSTNVQFVYFQTLKMQKYTFFIL